MVTTLASGDRPGDLISRHRPGNANQCVHPERPTGTPSEPLSLPPISTPRPSSQQPRPPPYRHSSIQNTTDTPQHKDHRHNAHKHHRHNATSTQGATRCWPTTHAIPVALRALPRGGCGGRGGSCGAWGPLRGCQVVWGCRRRHSERLHLGVGGTVRRSNVLRKSVRRRCGERETGMPWKCRSKTFE